MQCHSIRCWRRMTTWRGESRKAAKGRACPGQPVSVFPGRWKYILIKVILVYEGKSVFLKIVENNSWVPFLSLYLCLIYLPLPCNLMLMYMVLVLFSSSLFFYLSAAEVWIQSFPWFKIQKVQEETLKSPHSILLAIGFPFQKQPLLSFVFVVF